MLSCEEKLDVQPADDEGGEGEIVDEEVGRGGTLCDSEETGAGEVLVYSKCILISMLYVYLIVWVKGRWSY